MKLLGWYPKVSWGLCGIFIAVILVELITGVYLIRLSMQQEVLSERLDSILKNYLLVVLIVNINLITWFFPSRESWMFIFYFIILMTFFLDVGFVVKCAVAEVISMLILFLGKSVTRPADELFRSDMVLRIINISLSMFGVIVLMIFVNRFLLNAKRSSWKRITIKSKIF